MVIRIPEYVRHTACEIRHVVTSPAGLVRPCTETDVAMGVLRTYYVARPGDVVIRATTFMFGKPEPTWTCGIIRPSGSVSTVEASHDEIFDLCRLVPIELLNWLSCCDGRTPQPPQ